MKYEQFVEKVCDVPVIETQSFITGISDSKSLTVQLSRWVRTGKLIQLKRGFYLLPIKYRKVEPNEFYLASMLQKPSYVSLEKALEYHDLIPEAVSVFTSVTTKRPLKLKTAAGTYKYRHIKPLLFFGYNSVKKDRQIFFIASPEKALLDLFYLRHSKLTQEYLDELRLQNTEKINLGKLALFARRFHKPKMKVVARMLKQYIKTSRGGEKKL